FHAPRRGDAVRMNLPIDRESRDAEQRRRAGFHLGRRLGGVALRRRDDAECRGGGEQNFGKQHGQSSVVVLSVSRAPITVTGRSSIGKEAGFPPPIINTLFWKKWPVSSWRSRATRVNVWPRDGIFCVGWAVPTSHFHARSHIGGHSPPYRRRACR